MKYSLFFFLPLLLIACKPYSSPSPRKVLAVDTVFTSGQAEAYGRYYSNLERNVCSLTLVSQGITIHGDTLSGTGSELVFTDIFLPLETDTLPEGTYRVDSTAAAFSALSAGGGYRHLFASVGRWSAATHIYVPVGFIHAAPMGGYYGYGDSFANS